MLMLVWAHAKISNNWKGTNTLVLFVYLIISSCLSSLCMYYVDIITNFCVTFSSLLFVYTSFFKYLSINNNNNMLKPFPARFRYNTKCANELVIFEMVFITNNFFLFICFFCCAIFSSSQRDIKLKIWFFSSTPFMFSLCRYKTFVPFITNRMCICWPLNYTNFFRIAHRVRVTHCLEKVVAVYIETLRAISRLNYWYLWLWHSPYMNTSVIIIILLLFLLKVIISYQKK